MSRSSGRRPAYALALAAICLAVWSRAYAGVSLIGCTTGTGTSTTLPANASGDMIALCVSSSGQPGVVSTYTRLQPTACANSNSNVDLQWKVSGGSESAPTLSGSTFYSWAICVYRGQDPSTPWETVSGADPSKCTVDVVDGNVTAPQITTTKANDVYIDCSSLTSSYTNGSSALTQEKLTQFSGGSNYGVSFQDLTTSSAGTYGTYAMGTQSGAAGISNRAAALIPGPTPTPTPTPTATGTPTPTATPTPISRAVMILR